MPNRDPIIQVLSYSTGEVLAEYEEVGTRSNPLLGMDWWDIEGKNYPGGTWWANDRGAKFRYTGTPASWDSEEEWDEKDT